MEKREEGLKVGQVYSPYKLFIGSFIPNWVLTRTDLTSNDKLVWAKLAQHSGEDGKCYPAQATLAAEIGVNETTVNTSIRHLVNLKMIQKHNPAGWEKLAHRNCSYEFVIDGTLFFHLSEHENFKSRNVKNPCPNIRESDKEKNIKKDLIINKDQQQSPKDIVSDSSSNSNSKNVSKVNHQKHICNIYPNQEKDEDKYSDWKYNQYNSWGKYLYEKLDVSREVLNADLGWLDYLVEKIESQKWSSVPNGKTAQWLKEYILGKE